MIGLLFVVYGRASAGAERQSNQRFGVSPAIKGRQP
jgi:hypothetical protein